MAERKYPEFFEFLSRISSRILLRIFPEFFEEISCFVSQEKETRKKSPKIPALFQCKIPRQLRKNDSQKCVWRAGKVRKCGWLAIMWLALGDPPHTQSRMSYKWSSLCCALCWVPVPLSRFFREMLFCTSWCIAPWYHQQPPRKGNVSRVAKELREGVNREKLTVKKIINAWRCFFHRLCPL